MKTGLYLVSSPTDSVVQIRAIGKKYSSHKDVSISGIWEADQNSKRGSGEALIYMALDSTADVMYSLKQSFVLYSNK